MEVAGNCASEKEAPKKTKVIKGKSNYGDGVGGNNDKEDKEKNRCELTVEKRE